MNYYRRYCGDYAAATPHLSLLEHGAYTLLLDAYYSAERPLPTAYDLLYRICRANTTAEKQAVRNVAEQFFPSDGEFRRNPRTDKEIELAKGRADVASDNGKKGAKARWGLDGKPHSKTDGKPHGKRDGEGDSKKIALQPPTPNHQPNPEKRFPSDSTTAQAGTLGAAALASLKPLTLDEAKVPGGDDTPAALLASVLKANAVRNGTAFHPLVVEWSRTGVTVESLKEAIAIAKTRPGKDAPGSFGVEYLDPILQNPSKPVAQVQAEKGAKQAAASAERAQQLIEKQRSTPKTEMPAELRQKFAKGAP